MAMEMGNTIIIFSLVLFFLAAVSLVISMHEAAHAYVANKLGDPTARLLGRVTLNPTAHIDPIGTVIIPLVILVISGFRFVFGWAKPTPINPLNFKNPRQDSALTALAGPASNFLLAAIIGIITRLLPLSSLDKSVLASSVIGGNIPNLLDLFSINLAAFIFVILLLTMVLNLILGIFNLIPVPPLDGYKVLLGIVPKDLALRLAVLESYGPIILIIFLLFFIRVFSPIIFAILSFFLQILTGA